jgi:DNA-binding transcriptional LysR family regulator
MNFTLNQLKIFLKVVENKSITKAAEELFLTQPAVSIQLKNFQDQFALPLIQLVNRKVYVTDFGIEISKTAEKILNEVDGINFKMASFTGKLSGRLKISVVSTGKYVIPYFLSDFLRDNPDIELQLDVSNRSQIISDLESNNVDFSLVSVIPDQLNLERIALIKNKLFLVGSYDLKIDELGKVTEIFNSLPLIYREEGSATRNAMEDFVQKNGFSIRKKMVLTSNEAVKQAVIAKLGVSIMPLIGIRNELANKQLKIIPFKKLPLMTEWNLVWNKGKKMYPVAQAFIDYLNKHKKEIIEAHFLPDEQI